MLIKLTTKNYASFLVEFRQADIANAASRAETEVEYVDDAGASHKYYYRSPNFELIAYGAGNARINLTTYNHVPNMGSVDKADLERALQTGGNGGTVMNVHLSRVVALTSEAARSRIVERSMTQAILGRASANLDSMEFLFKAYKQPATFCGYMDVSGAYTTQWKPLDKTDYQRFFLSEKFTGDRKANYDAVAAL